MINTYQKHAQIFKALSDEKRLQILEILKGGEKCACVLLEQLDMGQSGLSYHMKILVASGIVVSRQEGKWTHYSISPDGAERAVALLHTLTEAEKGMGRGACCPRV